MKLTIEIPDTADEHVLAAFGVADAAEAEAAITKWVADRLYAFVEEAVVGQERTVAQLAAGAAEKAKRDEVQDALGTKASADQLAPVESAQE